MNSVRFRLQIAKKRCWIHSITILLLTELLLFSGAASAQSFARVSHPSERHLPTHRIGMGLSLPATTILPLSTDNLLQDSSFELYTPNPYWTESSTNFGTPLCTIADCGGTNGGPHTGGVWAWFGRTPIDEMGSLSQTVTFPNGSASLEFYLWIGSAGVGSDAADKFTVTIDGDPVFLANATEAASYPTYSFVSMDVSAYADGASHTVMFSSETTGEQVDFNLDDVTLRNSPGSFSKTSPTNGVIGEPVNPTTLSWTPSSGAAFYEYCFDKTNDNSCSSFGSWTPAGAATSVNISGLNSGTTYYWQVRAHGLGGVTYANGSSAANWSFTTTDTPAPYNFKLLGPVLGATGQPTNPILSWSYSSKATSYEYCYDTTNDNACSSWISTGTATSAALSGLNPYTTYYWQVRARNANGVTYANGGIGTPYWSFNVTTGILWKGTNQAMSFNVSLSGAEWSNFYLRTHFFVPTPYPDWTDVTIPGPGSISDGQFSYTSSTFSFSGQFNSPLSASGGYVFNNYPVRLCDMWEPSYCYYYYLTKSGTWHADLPTHINVFMGGTQLGNHKYDMYSRTINANYADVDAGPVQVISNDSAIVASLRDLWWNGSAYTSSTQLMGLPQSLLSDTYVFPSYNNVDLDEQLRFGNVGDAPTTVTVTIGGKLMGSYDLAPNQRQKVNYPGVDNGPVVVHSSNGVSIIASIRDAWINNGVTSSYSQLMGLPQSLLSDTYYLPSYNNVNLSDQLRFGNVGDADTTVTVTIAGQVMGTYDLAPNQREKVSYPGVDNGPVVVHSSNGVPIVASLREAWLNNGVTTSYFQMMGLPESQLSDKYVFPHYDNVTLSGQLRFGNVGNASTTVTVAIHGVLKGTYTYNLAPNQREKVSYPGLNSGPVVIQSSNGVPIIAALRDAWLVNGVTNSFSQLMGLPGSQLSTIYVFPSYNNVTYDNQLRIGVP